MGDNNKSKQRESIATDCVAPFMVILIVLFMFLSLSGMFLGIIVGLVGIAIIVLLFRIASILQDIKDKCAEK